MADSKEIISSVNAVTGGRRAARGRIAMISTHGYVAAEPPLGKPDTGGQVVYVLELSKKLAELGYQVDIWTRQFEDYPSEEDVASDVRVLRMPCGGDEFIPKEYLHEKLPEFVDRALRYIKEHDLRYAFINSHYWDAGLVGQALSEKLDVPHIHTPHSLGSWKKRQMETDFPEDKEKLEKTYNFAQRIKSEKDIYHECDTLVATTPIQLDFFEKDYQVPKDKTVMIPPGYDDSRFFPVSEATRSVIREEMGLEGRQVVISVGRLSRNKGFDLLVDAFSVVAEKLENAYLLMALGSESEDTTEDPMLDEIVQKVKDLDLERRVTITGSLPDEAMADFYRSGDVFCLPSRYEPFGMTAIEAMACGAPTVVTTNGGLYRALEYGKDALYADSFDKHDFGLSIYKILKYPAISKRLSENGDRKARSLFTWTGIAQQLIFCAESRSGPRLDIADPVGE